MKYEVIDGIHVVYDEERGMFQSEHTVVEDALEYVVSAYNSRIDKELEFKEIIKQLEETIERYKSPMFKELESDLRYMKNDEIELRCKINNALNTW